MEIEIKMTTITVVLSPAHKKMMMTIKTIRMTTTKMTMMTTIKTLMMTTIKTLMMTKTMMMMTKMMSCPVMMK